MRIRDDVLAGDLPAGSSLGSEAELVARYDTGRSVVREAVSLLRWYGVAHMRRGRGGGLVVSERGPNPAASSLARWLRSMHTELDQLISLRAAIEDHCLAGLGELREQDERRLERQLAIDLQRTGIARASGSHNLHTLVAELSGNRVLALFVAALTTFTHESLAARATTSARTVTRTAAAHASIVDALLRRDLAAARVRLADHLHHDVDGGP